MLGEVGDFSIRVGITLLIVWAVIALGKSPHVKHVHFPKVIDLQMTLTPYRVVGSVHACVAQAADLQGGVLARTA